MKAWLKSIIIILVLLLELAWAVRPRFSPHGAVLDETYRHDQRLRALQAWGRDQTAASKAAYEAEVTLLDEHMTRRERVVLAAVLVTNIVGIFCFWKYLPSDGDGSQLGSGAGR